MAFMKHPTIHNHPHPPCLSSHQRGLQEYSPTPGGNALGEHPTDSGLVLGTFSLVIPEESRRQNQKTSLGTSSRVTMDLVSAFKIYTETCGHPEQGPTALSCHKKQM